MRDLYEEEDEELGDEMKYKREAIILIVKSF